MSRRSNSSKQKSKAKSAPASNGSPGLVIAKPTESISSQNEMLAASLLEAIKSVHEVDGMFSDYCSVNSAIMESSSGASIHDSASMTTESTAADRACVLCSSAETMATAVLERIEADTDFDSDFGANIFFDEASILNQSTTQGGPSDADMQVLKESEPLIRDEIRLDDCCFEDSPCMDDSASGTSEIVESDNAVDFDLPDKVQEVCKFETEGEYAGDSPFSRCPVSAVDAAVEILSQAECGEEISRITTPEIEKQIEETPPIFVNTVDPSFGGLKSELKELTETLRSEFRQSLEALQASQAAANSAQSEVLKTLTEIMFQSAGSRDIPADAVERALSGVEERLIARLEAVIGNVVPTANSSSPSAPGPIAARAGHGSPIKLQNAASSVTRSWEQIKNEMMTRGELTESSSTPKPQKPTTALPEVAQLTSDRHFRLPEQDLSLELPKAIDPDSASDQELRDAFREREAFIATLIARIRRQQESATGQLSAEQLRTLAEELPDELAEQVRHTLKQMDDLARMGELELSLERARIARQVNQLAHSRQLLERNARQMGMIVNADGTIVHGPNQAGRGSGSRRWLGKLGFGQ